MPASASAASIAPFAVLVLAWDEATPAVRTLLDSAEAALVLVPAAPPSAAAPPATTAPAPTAAPETPEAAETPGAAAATSAATSAAPAAASSAPDAASAAATAAPPTGASRVLRLSELTLAQLAGQAGQALPTPALSARATTAPAAPYLGASPAAGLPADVAAALAAFENAPLRADDAPPVVAAPDLAAPLFATPAASVSAIHDEVPLAGTTPDLPPGLAGPAAVFPAAPEAASASAKALRLDAMPVFSEEDSTLAAPSPLGAAPTDLPADLPLDESAPLEDGPALPPAQAGWDAALVALRSPSSEEIDLVPATEGTRYDQPDLNYQIIQYARFAVPVALAEAPFAVIYAPAWPTWLAALELRQRTGRPLVLHLHALAAGRQPADTAPGWPAEIQRQALRQADVVLTETYGLARRLHRELGLPTSAVRVARATDGPAVLRALHRAQPRPKAPPAPAPDAAPAAQP